MPINENALKTSLGSGAIYPVYIILGNDEFLKKQSVNRIIRESVGEDDGLNLLWFERGCNLQDLYDELNGFPVMSDKKCVVLTDYDIEDCENADFERLITLASDRYETSVFIIWFNSINPDLKKSDRIKKLIKAAESAGGVTAVIDHRTQDELARQLCSSAKKQGSLLSPAVARYLIDTCSTEIRILSNELSKLIHYANGAEITKEMVDRVTVKSVDASVFSLSTKIIYGDTAGAMSLLDELYFLKIKPEIIIHSISSAFVDMFRVLASKGRSISIDQLAENFKMKGKEFVLRRAAENLRHYDYKKLELSFGALISAERKIKSYSSDSRTIMEQLIVELIYIMKTGEALD